MCGIAGVVWDDRERIVPRPTVDRMCTALAHRGPDAAGVWLGPGIGLGHRRLSVIDLSAAATQPMPNEDGSVRVVFNGEIYNFVELRRELIARGHQLRSHSDTEVIVHLYEEHGDGLLDYLDGMFAFGLWDAPRRRLLLARDRVGKKPLKYAQLSGGIAFASELKALVASGLVAPDIALEDVETFLSFGYLPSPGTGFASIRKLPAGHKLVYEAGRTHVERYWGVDFAAKVERTPEQWRVAVRDTVEAAVRRRLVSDVPLGAFLSGGIDSSIVVACMARFSNAPVQTFSVGFEHEAYNELPFARQIAKQYGTAHHEFRLRADDVDLLPELARVYEEPYADPAALPSYLLSRETRAHVTVVLTGDGGDEGFGGYERYAQTLTWQRRGVWLRRSGVRAALQLLLRLTRPGDARLDRRIDGLLQLSDRELGRCYGWLVRLFSSRELDAMLCGRVRGPRGDSPLARISQWIAEPRAGTDAMDRLGFADMCGYLPDDLLVKMDLASMAHGLEARSPLLDHRVVELAASAPASIRCPRGSLKGLLKDAFRELLPADLIDRPKQGFALPLQEWFRGPLLPLARDLLLARDARTRDLLDERATARVIEDHVRGRASRGFQLWALLMLELWIREVVDAWARAASAAALEADGAPHEVAGGVSAARPKA